MSRQLLVGGVCTVDDAGVATEPVLDGTMAVPPGTNFMQIVRIDTDGTTKVIFLDGSQARSGEQWVTTSHLACLTSEGTARFDALQRPPPTPCCVLKRTSGGRVGQNFHLTISGTPQTGYDLVFHHDLWHGDAMFEEEEDYRGQSLENTGPNSFRFRITSIDKRHDERRWTETPDDMIVTLVVNQMSVNHITRIDQLPGCWFDE